MRKLEPIDDLLTQIPEGWDFFVGSYWDEDTGDTVFTARLQQRALGEFLHLGHYLREIEKDGKSLRDAIQSALADL